MTPIRILHLTKSIGLYGAEKVILNLYDSINRDKYVMSVGAMVHDRHPHRELLEEVEQRGGESIAINCSKKIDPRALQKLISIVREKDIHILHCHEMKSRLYGLIAAKCLRIPILTTNHNWIRENLVVGTYEVLDAWYLRFFDHVIAVSDEVKESMLKFRIQSTLMSVVANGINLQECNKRRSPDAYLKQALGIRKDARVIGGVGRLSAEKGFRFFLDAAKQVLAEVPETWFLIVGDGPLREQLEEHARLLGIADRVCFAGFHRNILDLYSLMDVYVLSSLREGTPMALLEAMAMGLPAVATGVGGVSKIIRANHNGMLVRSHDAQAVCDAILYLLTHPDEAARLAMNGKQTVKDEYSAQRMARDYETIYNNIRVGPQP